MEAHEVLREVLSKYGFKRFAADSGFCLSSIYKWCEPDGGKASGMENPLQRTWALLHVTQDPRLLDWLCRKSGGRFVPSQPASPPPLALPEAELKWLRDLGEVHLALAETLAHPESSALRQTLRRRWEALNADLEGLLRGLEQAELRQGFVARFARS